VSVTDCIPCSATNPSHGQDSSRPSRTATELKYQKSTSPDLIFGTSDAGAKQLVSSAVHERLLEKPLTLDRAKTVKGPARLH
jgi:hypothetical protein